MASLFVTWPKALSIASFSVVVASGINAAMWSYICADVEQVRDDVKELRAEFKADVQELRAEVKADVQELRAEVKADVQELRAEVKADVQELRAEVKADINSLREDMREIRQMLIRRRF
jgi:uncharacterized protein YdhG (YjbR/CyaY superfamily)